MYLLIIVFVLSLSFIGLFFYLRWHANLFLKYKRSLEDGIGKYLVQAQKHKAYVQSIDGKDCLYYSLIIGSSGSGNNLYDIFPIHNTFLLKMQDHSFIINSVDVKFDLHRRFLTFAIVPSMTSRFITKSPTKDQYIEFYHKYSVDDTQHKKAYGYYDTSIDEGNQYTFIAKFENGLLDNSFTPIIIDDEEREKKRVLITSFLIMLPAIITIFAVAYKL